MPCLADFSLKASGYRYDFSLSTGQCRSTQGLRRRVDVFVDNYYIWVLSFLNALYIDVDGVLLT